MDDILRIDHSSWPSIITHLLIALGIGYLLVRTLRLMIFAAIALVLLFAVGFVLFMVYGEHPVVKEKVEQAEEAIEAARPEAEGILHIVEGYGLYVWERVKLNFSFIHIIGFGLGVILAIWRRPRDASKQNTQNQNVT